MISILTEHYSINLLIATMRANRAIGMAGFPDQWTSNPFIIQASAPTDSSLMTDPHRGHEPKWQDPEEAATKTLGFRVAPPFWGLFWAKQVHK
jgi:hypothetical protein